MDSVPVDYGRGLVLYQYGGVRIMTPQDHQSSWLTRRGPGSGTWAALACPGARTATESCDALGRLTSVTDRSDRGNPAVVDRLGGCRLAEIAPVQDASGQYEGRSMDV